MANQVTQKKVAILLPTRNGARFIEPQLTSLRENTTKFELHWLDDHSTDDTTRVFRELTERLNISVREWHRPDRQGVPGAFFFLLESVEADCYLFCDQDDIWQAGKIDATVKELAVEEGRPKLLFSEPMLFTGENPETVRRLFEVIGVSPGDAQMLSRAFLMNPAVGNTVGITRSLRDIFMEHRSIAWSHAIMHDWWLYLIASSSGAVRLMQNVPTTLYRQHGANVSGIRMKGHGRSIASRWHALQRQRWAISRQARGFLQAASLMKRNPALDLLVTHAQRAQNWERRLRFRELLELAGSGALPLPLRRTILVSCISLVCDARYSGPESGVARNERTP